LGRDFKESDINRAMADVRRGDTIKPVLRISGLWAPRRTGNPFVVTGKKNERERQ